MAASFSEESELGRIGAEGVIRRFGGRMRIMSNNQDVPAEQYARNLAAASYPEARDVPGMPTAFRRRWVLRLGSNLPARDILEDTVKSFERSVRRVIAEALELPGDVELTLPVVSTIRL